MSPKAANRIALALFILGLSQMLGSVTGLKALKGLGAAWGFAPNPKVFSDVDGLETFASEFTLHWKVKGQAQSLSITPELYSRLQGPYNRRNVYGAALSYAPRMPEALWQPVFCHGLAPGGPLRRELGVSEDAQDFAIEIKTKTKGRNDQWLLRPACLP